MSEKCERCDTKNEAYQNTFYGYWMCLECMLEIDWMEEHQNDD